MSSNSTTVSAPGKVLLAGGYLVLESPNVGVVVAANKRFYTTVLTETAAMTTSSPGDDDKPISIVVTSPQFHTSWTYALQPSSDQFALLADSNNESTNPFVEKSLRVVLAYLYQIDQLSLQQTQSLHIVIRADNDFYSVLPHLHGKERTPANVDALPTFCPCPVDPETGKAIIHKTGLGSSAALTTSLVGALYVHFTKKLDLLPIHNLAQLCHCYAQGKVGSGFDVSAAVYATHVYRRFSKCLLPDILQQFESHAVLVTESTRSLLQSIVDTSWGDDLVTHLNLPPGIQILLADVCGGSESPGMARQVVNWKQQQQAAESSTILHWTDLQKLNQRVVELLQTLTATTSTSPVDVVSLASCKACDWNMMKDNPMAGILYDLSNTFSEIRRHLRGMGQEAGVPVEPPEQTELCDATSELPGVITALVPGAGGYDAVVCLYVDNSAIKQRIGDLWSHWDQRDPQRSGQVVCPLAVQATNVGIQVETHFSTI